MKKVLVIAFLCFAHFVGGSEMSRQTTALSHAETDAVLDKIFALQKKLTHLQTKVISRKTGGIFAGRAIATLGYAYAQMPDLLLFVDRGEVEKPLPENQASYILIDGMYLWDMKNSDTPDVYEAERIDLKNAGERDLNIASLLIGAEVNNSSELRQIYEVAGEVETAATGVKSYHFRFKTLPDKSKDEREEESELWIKDGEIIPWRLRVTTKTKKTDVFDEGKVTYKTTVSEKEFSDTQTNFSQPPLPPFAVAERFYIGTLLNKHRGTKVSERGQIIPNQQLTNDLKNILSRLQEKQKK